MSDLPVNFTIAGKSRALIHINAGGTNTAQQYARGLFLYEILISQPR
jgi:hypothetical protein